MSTRKRTIAAALAVVLSGAAVTYSYADTTPPPADQAATQVDETVSGGASATEEAKISQQALVAVRDSHLARMALNDGYTDHAKELLQHAQKLLSEVTAENKPVTVTTEVKEGEKQVSSEERTVTPDIIPILSELQVVEDFSADGKKAEAVKQANQQMSQGQRDQAVETLRLAEVGLVSLDVSMRLSETASYVDHALKLIDEGKLHEANLELKKVGDALVKETNILVQPVANKATTKSPAAAVQPESATKSAG